MGHVTSPNKTLHNGSTTVPDPTTFKLPGGAMLVAMAKSGQSKSKPRPQEPPDVSITLSHPKTKQIDVYIQQHDQTTETVQTDSIVVPTRSELAPPPCPSPVIARLHELGLNLSHLPTVLAVYKESRERYRDLVREDYVLSWSRLLHHRSESFIGIC